MGFFSRKQKQLALKTSTYDLEKAYHVSEQNLKKVSASGDEKLLKSAMKQHGNYEYAMLYKQTPEYKERLSKLRRK